MLTYQIRQRVFRLDGGTSLRFPHEGCVNFYFSPKQSFGMEAGGGRTAVRAVAASMFFNANSGAHSIESKQPLSPLDVTIQEPERTTKLKGNTLSITQLFESNEQLTATVESFYYACPILLAVDYADPPIIERVDGAVGPVNFRWELAKWDARYETTTQEQQEKAFINCFERMVALSLPGRRRVLAALHYFYVALRLSRRGEIAGEFLAEMILNLTKVLEVLFPPVGDGKTRDAVRRGLAALGFTAGEIEAKYLPCMALRNFIDVGHVDLSLFKNEHLTVIHEYVEHSELDFRDLLRRVLNRLMTGELHVPEYDPEPASGDALKVIERMRRNAPAKGL